MSYCVEILSERMALPSFHLTEIPEEGLELTCEVHPDELALASEEAQVVGILSVTLTIFMAGTRIDVNGSLHGTVRRQCVRCLKEYDDALEVPFAAEYHCELPAKRQGKSVTDAARRTPERGEERQESGLDEEVYMCVGDRLELGEMLREHIILGTPMQPLCREDCSGLCPHCGQDLNEWACGCIEQNRTNPFAILRDVRRKSEQ